MSFVNNFIITVHTNVIFMCNTPPYGLNSVPLITMIEKKNFEQVNEIHSNNF